MSSASLSQDASRQIERLPEERRTPELVSKIYERVLVQTVERQRQLDAETSGTFDPANLDRWVRVLSRQMAELCGKGPECKVETPD